jgi:cyclin-dependent kinase 12/13
MWSIGCIFAELMLRTPLLPGKEEREQLELIFALCGTPTAENWPGHETLPDWPNWAEKVKKEPRSRSLAKKFSQCSM